MSSAVPAAIEGALAEIEHSQVCKVQRYEHDKSGWLVETRFAVQLPQRDKKKGETRLGVRAEEPVWFLFPHNYPMEAPGILLRPDFPSDFPHLYPYTSEKGYRLPCVYAGRLSDLLHSGLRLHPILVQVNDWLARAAREGLYDEKIGWEPIILPEAHGTLSIETSILLERIDRREGAKDTPLQIHRIGNNTYFTRRFGARDDTKIDYGSLTRSDGAQQTVLLEVWPADVHTSERRDILNVSTLEELLVRVDAKAKGLWFPPLKHLKRIAADINHAVGGALSTAPVVLVLVMRRPVQITAQSHALEPIPYLLDLPVRRPQELEAKDIRIRPLSHRQPPSPELSARISGVSIAPSNFPTILIGAGSLGSKVGVHLIKAGVGPLVFVDDGLIVPHVLVRHELNYPLEKPYKAEAMAMMAGAHGVYAYPHVGDVADILNEEPGKRWQDFGIERARFVIDTTASYHAQEALVSAKSLPGRLISASFFANGEAGALFIEGENRSTRLDDLKAALYDRAMQDDLHPFVHGAAMTLDRKYVGIGCHAMTMTMSNAQAALFGAGIGKKILHYHSHPPALEGEWWFGHTDSSGLGAVWQGQSLGPTCVLGSKQQSQRGWEVRILGPVVAKMRADLAKCTPVETGGPLYGIINPLMRRITITRTEEAPADSIRQASRFVHGTDGLRARAVEIEKKSRGLIEFVGTWHSHPQGGGASATDRSTARIFAALRGCGPFLMVIAQPNGSFVSIIEEGD